MAEPEVSTESKMKPRGGVPRWLKWSLIGLGGAILLPIGVLVIVAFTVDLGGIVKGRIDAMRPGLELQIGRKIAVGDVSVRLLPRVAVEIKDLSVAAEPGQTGDAALPLVEVGVVRVGLAVWPLIATFGHSVELSRIEVIAPRINVVRGTDGKLSYQDILDRQDTVEKPPKKPLTPEELDEIGRVSLGRFAVEGAALRFRDLERAGVVVIIEQLDVVAQDVRLKSPITVTVDAAVLAEKRNFHFAITAGPLPADLEVEVPLALLRNAELKVLPLELEPLLRFLPPSRGIELARALVDADVKIEMPAVASKLHVQADMGAAGLILEQREKKGSVERGQPLDARLKLDLLFDPLAGDVEAKLLDLTLNKMGVGGKIDLRSMWSSPSVRSLDVASHDLTLEGLAAVLPPSSLPHDATLRGPLAIKASAGGSPQSASVEVAVDLTSATLLLPQLHKPAGVALDVGFRGLVKPTGIDVERLGLVLGPLSLLIHGHVKSADDLDLDLDSGKVDLDPLLRLLPTVARSVPAGEKLAGGLQISGSAKRHGAQLDAGVHVVLQGANVHAPTLDLTGGLDLSATARLNKTSDTVEANLDLTAARIVVAGELDKAAGVAMGLRLSAERNGNLATIKEAKLSLPGGIVELTGKADLAAHTLVAQVPLVDLDLALLARVVPMLKKSLPPAFSDGKLKFALKVDGDPQKLDSLHARIDQLDLVAAGTHLTGEADIVGLSEPKTASFTLHADRLDLDRFISPEPAPAAAEPVATKKSGPVALPRFLRTVEGAGSLKVDAGSYGKVLFKDLIGELTISRGKATFKSLHLSAFGGLITADGTTANFNSDRPKLSIAARLQQVQIGQIVAVKSATLGDKLEGKGNLDLNCEASGLTWAQIAPQLSGQLGMALSEGKLKTPSLSASAIREVVSKVPGFAADAALVPEGTSLRNLSAKFSIVDGQLRTNQPLDLNTDQGAIHLTGAIGLDESLAMLGNMDLSPKALEEVSGGRLKITSSIPLQMKIGGSITHPSFQIANIEKTVAVIASSLLAGQGQALLKGALGGAAGGQAAGVVGRLGQAVQQATSGGTGQAPQGSPINQIKQVAPAQVVDEAAKQLQGIFGR